MQRTLGFLALLLTALALVPTGAHLFALPNKIGMSAQDYLAAQQAYAGWAWFGVVLISATAADLALAVSLRDERPAFALALAGGLMLAATLAVFFAWTFPANQATANWTVLPADWQALRRRWELSHAANALLTLLAFACVALAIVRRGPDVSRDR